MKGLLLLVFYMIFVHIAVAQSSTDTLSLEESYKILYSENPITDKINTNRQITEINKRIAQLGWYPFIELGASASYQSQVVEFPFESSAFEIPTFSKDHYNISLNVTQPIYDGGRTKAVKSIENESGKISEASLESDLLNLKEQLDRVYFGILILQKQSEILQLAVTNLKKQLELIQSQVSNGLLLPGNEAVLQAEILDKEQQLIKLNRDRIAGYEALRIILGEEVSINPVLKLPENDNWRDSEPLEKRPELNLLSAREQLFASQQDLTSASSLPQVSLFANPFYGRPGFNVFEDDLQFNWIIGVQARWNFKTVRQATLKKDIIELQKKDISEDRTLFERQQEAALSRLMQEIMTLEQQIQKDEMIIELRKQVADEKRALVQEGSATVTEYITEYNIYIRAQRQLDYRKIQRIQAIINYKTELGWRWN